MITTNTGPSSFLWLAGIILLISLESVAQIQPLSRNDQAQIELSIGLHEKAIQEAKWEEASRHLNDIAFLYWEHNDYENAIKFYEQSVALNDSFDNEKGLAMLHNNLGMLYSDIREYEKSLQYFEKTLATRRALDNMEGIIATIKNVSVAQNNLGRFDESVELLQEALSLARGLNDPDEIAGCYLMLSETYEKAGDVANTRHYYELYQSFHSMQQDRDMRRLQQIADEEALKREIAELEERKRQSELQLIQSQLEAAVQELDQFDDDLVALSDSLDKTQLQNRFLETSRENERLVSHEQLRTARFSRTISIIIGVVILFLAAGLYSRLRYTNRTKRIIESEKARSEELLLNILPSEVADELQENGKYVARSYSDVTVLFTDFQGFTSISERLTAEELVAEIDTCFKAFDQIITRYGIEKIKTIGDAYMAAGGLHNEGKRSARSVVLAALELQDFIHDRRSELEENDKSFFEMRIGIHTGPVVAGIVGIKKFQYDIWGDTVNIASRLENHGEVAKVNVSESTYQILKDDPDLDFDPRGKIEVKNRGKIGMYFVQKSQRANHLGTQSAPKGVM